MVRYIAFMVAGFCAGISGGLAALNFEIGTSEVVSSYRSGASLLCTFLGGATFFFGPIIGAILMVLATVLLSEFTQAWLLYLGLVFLFMVMFAPGGIASLVMMNLRVAAFGHFRKLWLPYLGVVLTGIVAFVGLAAMIEMVYHLQLNAALSPELRFMGVTLSTQGAQGWLSVALVLAVGGALFTIACRRFGQVWGGIQSAIAVEIQKREGTV